MKTWKIFVLMAILVMAGLSACSSGPDPEASINREELSQVQRKLFDLYATYPSGYVDGYVIIAVDGEFKTYWVGGEFASKDGRQYNAILNYWPSTFQGVKGEKVSRQKGGYYYVEEPAKPELEDLVCDTQDLPAPENWAQMLPEGFYVLRYIIYNCIFWETP